jgi:xanthosine utilization system XapX-like protein
MQDLVIAVLGVAGILIGIKVFDNINVNRNQKKLEDKVKKNDKKIAGLEGEQRQEDKETQRKVDEINKEQNDKPEGKDLADWFNRRK